MFNLFKKRTEKPVLPAGKMMSRDDIIAFLKTFLKSFSNSRSSTKQRYCQTMCRQMQTHFL